jgi:hypothetical protein
VIFIQKGNLDIGYEINKKKRFVIRLHNHCMIGAYNCCYNEPSTFIYRCKGNCEGYFLRKESLISLLNMDSDINDFMRDQIKQQYQMKIKYKVFAIKEAHLQKIMARSDVKNMLYVIDKGAIDFKLQAEEPEEEIAGNMNIRFD